MHPNVEVSRVLGRLGSAALSRARVGETPALWVEGPSAAGIADGHARAGGGVIPRVLARRDDGAALEVEPLATLTDCLTALPHRSVPYEEGIVVTWTLARAFADAHARGVTLGAVASANLVVSTAGKLHVVGFGGERAAWAEGAACAPAVAAGRAPTALTDLHAGLLFVRSVVPWLAGLPERLERVLAGEAGPVERAFQRALFSVLSLTGAADGAYALATLERYWRSLGVWPNEAALARRLLSLRRGARLVLGPRAEWFSIDDAAPVDLRRRRAARLVLSALAAAAPAPCKPEALIEAGWPGEALVGTSGADRLYVLLSMLRELGLRDVLERSDSGYSLRADIRHG